MANVAFIRVDRIGDLVLTLPAEIFWSKNRPEDRITWIVNSDLQFVIESFESNGDAIYLARPKSFFEKIKAMLKMRRTLKERAFDQVIFFHCPWWVAAAGFLARVPQRLGVASQWFSFVFFNQRLRQRRSDATKNEADYNLDLVSHALKLPSEKASPTQIYADANRVNAWKLNLQEKGILQFILVHPGMGGSAKNWSAVQYDEFINLVTQEGLQVVVTGSPMDRPFLAQLKTFKHSGVFSFVDQTDGKDLLALLSLSEAVVAPSTGVAHLAAALGKKVAGIYSPVRVQTPRRWGPLGASVKTFVPEVHCPAAHKCLGAQCALFECMDQISPKSVYEWIKNFR